MNDRFPDQQLISRMTEYGARSSRQKSTASALVRPCPSSERLQRKEGFRRRFKSAGIEGDRERNYRLIMTTDRAHRLWILVVVMMASACANVRNEPRDVWTAEAVSVTDVVNQPCDAAGGSKSQIACNEPTAIDFVRAEQESANELCRQLVDACAPSYPEDQRRAVTFRLSSIEHWVCQKTDAGSATCSYVDNGAITGRSSKRCTIGLMKNSAQRPLSAWAFQYQRGADGQITYPPRTIQPTCVTLPQ